MCVCGERENDIVNVAKCWEEIHMVNITQKFTIQWTNMLQYIQTTK